jgi:hypothetical protein
MSLRVTPATKRALDAAAISAGRSLSQEAEIRLENSFRGSGYLDQAMDLAYGPRLAVLLTVIGRAMNEIGGHASFPANWMDQAALFDEGVGAVVEALAAFRPEGSGRPSPILAPMIIRKLLAAIKNPDEAGELKDWAAPLHAKLGEAAERLRIEQWPQVTEESPGKFTVREGNR